MKWISERNGLPTVLLAAVGFLWIGSGAVYEFEHGINKQFQSYGDSFWWAFSTMATLGWGNGPTTIGGRVVAGVLMVLGIASFGLVTATATTFIMERMKGVHDYPTSDLMDAMKDLQGRLAGLEEALEHTHNLDPGVSTTVTGGPTAPS